MAMLFRRPPGRAAFEMRLHGRKRPEGTARARAREGRAPIRAGPICANPGAGDRQARDARQTPRQRLPARRGKPSTTDTFPQPNTWQRWGRELRPSHGGFWANFGWIGAPDLGRISAFLKIQILGGFIFSKKEKGITQARNQMYIFDRPQPGGYVTMRLSRCQPASGENKAGTGK